MAIDTKEKRAAVLGVGRPWMRDKFPVATPDPEWRASSGNIYGGNPVANANVIITFDAATWGYDSVAFDANRVIEFGVATWAAATLAFTVLGSIIIEFAVATWGWTSKTFFAGLPPIANVVVTIFREIRQKIGFGITDTDEERDF